MRKGEVEERRGEVEYEEEVPTCTREVEVSWRPWSRV